MVHMRRRSFPLFPLAPTEQVLAEQNGFPSGSIGDVSRVGRNAATPTIRKAQSAPSPQHKVTATDKPWRHHLIRISNLAALGGDGVTAVGTNEGDAIERHQLEYLSVCL